MALLREGLDELSFVMERMKSLPIGAAVADLSIARGFDYYTGTVYEGKLPDYPDFPVVLAGGRYDDLLGKFTNKSIPGIGISLGLTRVFSKMVQEKMIAPGRKSPTQVLVTVSDTSMRVPARQIADDLRARGINAEVYHEPGDLRPQLRYADKKGISHVLFTKMEETCFVCEVKDMISGGQKKIDVSSWEPNP